MPHVRQKHRIFVIDERKKRTVPDAEQRLYDDLKWAGLLWDEGTLRDDLFPLKKKID